MGHFDIKAADIKDESGVGEKIDEMYNRSKAQMNVRTNMFKLFTRLSHNQSLYTKGVNDVYSEGTTQALKRKIRAQTLQRVPDGEITTQFDKNSIEQVETEFIFDNKVLTSEYDGKDMLKNLWRAFNTAYDYGFACVRTGFEKDLDGDVRISWKEIRWNDIYPAPDADFIEEAEWYVVREYISQADIKALIDWDTKITQINQAGSIDLIWNGMTITPELEEQLTISVPYLANKQTCVVRAADFEKYSDIASFLANSKDAIVAVESGSAADLIMNMEL